MIWRKKTKCAFKPIIVGVITFVLFAQVLEGIPKLIFFGGMTQVSKYVLSHPWAYVLLGCLLAGVFEEVGRYVAFRFVLKKPKDKKTAISYGIGHGGIEILLVLGITSLVGIAVTKDYGFIRLLVDVMERVFAMILHIGLSIVVFKSVGEQKAGYLLAAVLLHMIFDVPAALYQCGLIGIFTAELALMISALVIGAVSFKMYSEMKELEEANGVFKNR